ncbi:MAG: acyl-CoA dehydrogenase C-terminal domain-containing protein, partial [Actinobacteria bacterium]|nr:acyl-CoA dehydrogenase C-terminal domain-containing protein [Actinomycetota bacterium]
VGKLGEWAMASTENVEEIYKVGLNTTKLLLMFGDLVIGWLLLRQGEIAQARLDEGVEGPDKDFYLGKVAAAKWFAHNRLPLLTSEKDTVLDTDSTIMELPETAF